jgi:hypothetical protein
MHAIAALDAQGVALAAIEGLAARVDAQQRRLPALRARIGALSAT